MGRNNSQLASRHGSFKDTPGAVLVIIGACLLFFALIEGNFRHDDFAPIVGGAICFGIGAGKIINARRLPKVQIMRLAESRDGLLSLSEITTALDIDPDIAIRTLKALAKAGIARQRWQEVQKNLWEFPDYMKSPPPEPAITPAAQVPRNLASTLSDPSPNPPSQEQSSAILQHQ